MAGSLDSIVGLFGDSLGKALPRIAVEEFEGFAAPRQYWRLSVNYWELIADEIKAEGWSIGWVRAYVGNALLWSVDANRGDGRRFIAQAEELVVAMLELQKMTRDAVGVK